MPTNRRSIRVNRPSHPAARRGTAAVSFRLHDSRRIANESAGAALTVKFAFDPTRGELSYQASLAGVPADRLFGAWIQRGKAGEKGPAMFPVLMRNEVQGAGTIVLPPAGARAARRRRAVPCGLYARQSTRLVTRPGRAAVILWTASTADRIRPGGVLDDRRDGPARLPRARPRAAPAIAAHRRPQRLPVGAARARCRAASTRWTSASRSRRS